jgi:hypothetical protein
VHHERSGQTVFIILVSEHQVDHGADCCSWLIFLSLRSWLQVFHLEIRSVCRVRSIEVCCCKKTIRLVGFRIRSLRSRQKKSNRDRRPRCTTEDVCPRASQLCLGRSGIAAPVLPRGLAIARLGDGSLRLITLTMDKMKVWIGSVLFGGAWCSACKEKILI